MEKLPEMTKEEVESELKNKCLSVENLFKALDLTDCDCSFEFLMYDRKQSELDLIKEVLECVHANILSALHSEIVVEYKKQDKYPWNELCEIDIEQSFPYTMKAYRDFSALKNE